MEDSYEAEEATRCPTAQNWPEHQGACQPPEATLGTVVKATATRQEENRVRNQLAFASQTLWKILEGHLLTPWSESPDSSVVHSGSARKHPSWPGPVPRCPAPAFKGLTSPTA